ncbi:unnamed protein product [Nesidiocoris tenuis]|uniref:Uncharacterized protein n=1 Tax=Nesidiocoris tenuis TaxID=355587 RepID=A0A6H5HB39_9HEMI|nr:unnamed protein product [Nesidiocoris tenuis]
MNEKSINIIIIEMHFQTVKEVRIKVRIDNEWRHRSSHSYYTDLCGDSKNGGVLEPYP